MSATADDKVESGERIDEKPHVHLFGSAAYQEPERPSAPRHGRCGHCRSLAPMDTLIKTSRPQAGSLFIGYAPSFKRRDNEGLRVPCGQ
jgi:hypothetical protein